MASWNIEYVFFSGVASGMTSGFHRHNGFLFLSGSGLSLGANTTLLLTLAPFCIKIMAQLQTENIKIMAQLQAEK